MGKKGRKKGASGEESRLLLLQIAAEEFAHKGYHSATISSIVKKAGLTQPSFYLYFSSKKSIFQELIESFRTELFRLTANSRIEEGVELTSLPEKITYKLEKIFEFFKHHPDETTIGLFMASESEEIKNQLAFIISENLKAEQELGYFKKNVDLNIMAEGLVGMMERLTATQLFPHRREPDEIAKEIVFLFLYGALPMDRNEEV